MRSPSVRQPESIHPALWRGSQLARSRQAAAPTGFPILDQELPARGWPLGSLIEFMPSQPGIGEIHLLRPALARLDTGRSIALVDPPYEPCFHCWLNWGLQAHRPLWIQPKTSSDTLWAAEQILKHNACSALLCWVDRLRSASLRRLHLAAQQTDMLFILLRPPSAAQQASAAPLRLSLSAWGQGVQVSIIKRRGPLCSRPLPIVLYPERMPHTMVNAHETTLDQRLPAHALPGSVLSLVGH